MLNYEPLIKLAEKLSCRVLLNEPMKLHTTFKIGGPVDVFLIPKDTRTLSEIIKFCTQNNIPKFVIGNGSNLLVRDKGIRGVCIKQDYTEERNRATIEGDTVECSGSIPLARLCKFAQVNNLAGLEFAWGIPGTVGGALYMNAGAYKGEMKDVVVSAIHIRPDGRYEELGKDAMYLSYRKSVYQENNGVIATVKMTLQRGKDEEIKERMSKIIRMRKEKQPLELPSAGSIFKKPKGFFAGELIEKSGLKGKRIGGACISNKHAGFIVNVGNASFKDVMELMELVQNKVFKESGVILEREIKIL